MTDRQVTVNEADLRRVLASGAIGGPAFDALRAALEALGPEPCGHPSKAYDPDDPQAIDPLFRCVAPKGHHAYRVNQTGPDAPKACCRKPPGDPAHCGVAHAPPPDVWAES